MDSMSFKEVGSGGFDTFSPIYVYFLRSFVLALYVQWRLFEIWDLIKRDIFCPSFYLILKQETRNKQQTKNLC